MKTMSMMIMLGALLCTTACSGSSPSSHYSSAWDEAFSQALVAVPAKK